MRAATQRIKPAKTLSGMLAAVFTASTRYPGKFYPDLFELGYENLTYHGDGVDDPKPDDFTEELIYSCPFGAHVSEYCCGLLEIGSLHSEVLDRDPDVAKALMQVWMSVIHTKYNMAFATTIATQKVARAYLEEAGFVPVATYKSKGTGATITVLMKDFTGIKEIPEGDLHLSNFDLCDRSC